MSNSKKPMRVRAVTVAGGIALIGAAGAGFAGSANAATTASAHPTLAKIKACESGGNYQARNSSSGASGAYQFLDSTWRSLSASAGYATAASAPASVQDAAALELYNAQGTSPWAASSGCWSSMTSAPSSSSTSSASGGTAAAAQGVHGAPKAAAQPIGQAAGLGHLAKPGAPKPNGKDANKHLPQAKGGQHHAKPGAPKPMKKVVTKQAHKPGEHRHAPAKAAA